MSKIKRKLQEDGKEEEKFDNGTCNCGEGTFCNGDMGFNRGFCEDCQWFPTLKNCGENGLPSLGIADCQFKCY